MAFWKRERPPIVGLRPGQCLGLPFGTDGVVVRLAPQPAASGQATEPANAE
jgi:hypothetical protein